MNRSEIIEIQEALRYLSNFEPALIPLVIDGIYGYQTKRAVTIFQTLYGLKPSGEVDYETWEELRIRSKEIQGVQPKALSLFPNPFFVLSPNDTHSLMPIIQYMINELSIDYSNIHPVKIHSSYDFETVKEIQNIQNMHKIEPNGIIDSRTWNVLVTLFENRPSSKQR